MPVINLPGGGSVISLGSQADADRQKAIIDARHTFAMKYCREHGWPEDPGQLSIDQILEIREHEEWKNPKVDP